MSCTSDSSDDPPTARGTFAPNFRLSMKRKPTKVLRTPSAKKKKPTPPAEAPPQSKTSPSFVLPTPPTTDSSDDDDDDDNSTSQPHPLRLLSLSSESPDNDSSNSNSNSDSESNASNNMGIQSQWREGAIKKAMKNGTKKKPPPSKASKGRYKQNVIPGGKPFDPMKHCKQCIGIARCKSAAPHLNVPYPKKAHHRRCPHSIYYKEGVAGYKARQALKRNKTLNNTPIEQKFKPGETAQEKASLWRAAKINSRKTAKHEGKNLEKMSSKVVTVEAVTKGDLGSELNAAMKDLVGRMESFPWLPKCRAPTAIALLFKYILTKCRQKRSKVNPSATTPKQLEQRDLYHQFFPKRECAFKIPPCPSNENMHPMYHSLVGHTIYNVDWTNSHPDCSLTCFRCGSKDIIHERAHFKKNRTLFPLWNADGIVSWCSLMSYKCQNCRQMFTSNDGRLLVTLKPSIREAYPVEPRYAEGTFHLHQQATDDMEAIFKTYGNGDFFCKKLYRSSALQFERKILSYISLGHEMSYVDYETWTGCNFPPSGQLLREYYAKAEQSTNWSYGYSNYHRYNLELQAVTTAGAITLDWTFQVVKTYILKGAKACFTMANDKGEIANIALVQSTAVSQVSHLLANMVNKRKGFRPKLLYADTWPNNNVFWHNIFGEHTIGRLGLFHQLQRIVGTMNSHSANYFKALWYLKQCFYRYHDKDYSEVIEALKDGTLHRDKRRLTDVEIQELQQSKVWKWKYDKYLRKVMFPPETIVHKLQQWLQRFENCIDHMGKHVFTKDTHKVTTEQYKKVKYIQDIPDFDPYHVLPPGPNSAHHCTEKLSRRPESRLEHFHGHVAHYANTGMNRTMADLIELRGTTEWNVRCRHKHLLLDNNGSIDKTPYYLRNVPRHWNHSNLAFINECARELGMKIPFKNVMPLKDDNGERFLSDYFVQQDVRNEKFGQDKESHKCRCPQCSTVTFPLVKSTALSKGHTIEDHSVEDVDLDLEPTTIDFHLDDEDKEREATQELAGSSPSLSTSKSQLRGPLKEERVPPRSWGTTVQQVHTVPSEAKQSITLNQVKTAPGTVIQIGEANTNNSSTFTPAPAPAPNFAPTSWLQPPPFQPMQMPMPFYHPMTMTYSQPTAYQPAPFIGTYPQIPSVPPPCPSDSCFSAPPYYCQTYSVYLQRHQRHGRGIPGPKPHCPSCPKKTGKL